ncbi:hyaluronate lyase [Duganella sp. FT80W]|uniref:Hyaluronate lyase n=1 Tax=Duganella guangzhouensis TaxID=2666084 RepID=A0A6I2KYJ1_9BURK|nr:polysaccharide lyase family 8 super-sandwich domain-containing protein [Duganella guangzhouensis]MRW91068.1 hyaluronate lyase [Duganella guangzhouensis]
MTHTTRLLAAGTLLLLMASASPVYADNFDDLRAKWLVALTGGSAADPTDADIATQIAVISANAQSYSTNLIRTSDRSALWSDQADFSKSATLSNNYGRLSTMALAYSTPGSTLYQDATLAADIVSALDWLNTSYYNTSTVYFDNWFHWQIAIPKTLNNIMTLMYGNLTAAQRANYIAAIDHFVPDPTKRKKANGDDFDLTETGANLIDKCMVVIVRGMLEKSPSKLITGRDALSGVLPYVTSGDGFYEDGSFVQHTTVAYTGGYGGSLLSAISKMIGLLGGSAWDFSDPAIANVYAWANNAFRPVIYDGAALDAVRGRNIAYESTGDHVAGRGMVAPMAQLALVAPASEAPALKAMVKGWIQRDTTFGSSYYQPTTTAGGTQTGLAITDLAALKSIANDSAVTAQDEATEARVFAGMDRVVQREPGHAFVLSLFSPRISAFEYGNGENIKGWWTGIGMTNLLNADQTQYLGNYWPTVDMTRLPGTTTDHTGSGTPVGFKSYLNTKAWVGGTVVNGRYAVAGMNYSMSGVTGSTLTGKKSWFMFGNRITALGAGITSSDNVAVETIVENRKLNSAGDNALTVDGSGKSVSAGWSESMADVKWAHLAGSVTGADIGYHFPVATTVQGLREARTGNWYAINNGSSSTGSTTAYTHTFLSLALNHGSNPSGAAYAYTLLPNLSALETSAYASAPTVRILENSSEAQAVNDTALQVTGANFWKNATKTVYDGTRHLITANRMASVAMQEADGELDVSVADPTQTNTDTIGVEIGRSATSVLSADSGVTVDQLSPSVKLTVAVSGAVGKSFSVRLGGVTTGVDVTPSLPAYQAPTTSVSSTSTLDAYIRGGTYASTAYGSNSYAVVAKASLRKALFQFSLSNVPDGATIKSAQVVLTPDTVSGTGITHRAFLLASNSWTESVTWNTQPAASSTTPLTTWTPAVGTAVSIDVTSAATAAISVDRKLSLLVDSLSDTYASYATREYTANTAYRPTLVVTYTPASSTTASVIDATASVKIAQSGLTLDRATQQSKGTVSFTNKTAASLNAPLVFRLDALSSGVTLANATGSQSGAPTLTLSQPTLAPGATITVATNFLNPNRVAISYVPKLFATQ